MGDVLNAKGSLLTIGGQTLTDLTSYDLDFEVKTEGVTSLASAVKRNLPVHRGWKLSADFEFPTLTRAAGGIQIGSWVGIDLIDFSFELDAEVEDVTSPNDEWAVYQLNSVDWKVSSQRYETAQNNGIFQALVDGQFGGTATVAVSTPFGVGVGVIDKASLKADSKTKKTTISVVPGASDLPTAGTYLSGFFGYIAAAATDVLSQGYATPLACTLPEGSGTAFITKLTGQGTETILKGKIELTGSGALA